MTIVLDNDTNFAYRSTGATQLTPKHSEKVVSYESYREFNARRRNLAPTVLITGLPRTLINNFT